MNKLLAILLLTFAASLFVATPQAEAGPARHHKLHKHHRKHHHHHHHHHHKAAVIR
jgi:hypothetical protein